MRLPTILLPACLLVPMLYQGLLRATTTPQVPVSEPAAWPCRPAPVALPKGFDPAEIYYASRPAILPDGKSFVFEWCDALWIASTEGGTAKLFLHSQGREAWPVVSHDGKKVAFQSNRNGTWRTYVADIADGSSIRQLSYNSEGDRPYAWSADDSELLCWALRDEVGSVFDRGRLFWMSVDGRKAERRLFDDAASDPSVSPDGRYVLFTQEGEDLYRKGFTGENASRIWCYDTKTYTFTLAVKKPTESLTPIWAPDGKGYYYVSGEGGTQNIWYRTFPEGREHKVTFFEGDSVIAPTLSADGRTMIFRQGAYFYTIDPTVAPAKPTKVTLYPEDSGLRLPKNRRRYYDSLWNNDWDGCSTSYGKGMEFGFTTGGDLYVMDTVLREPVLVYGDSRTQERDCVFSKDGSRLYFLSDRGDSVALLEARRKNDQRFWWENRAFDVRPLVDDSLSRSMLSVSPDGKRLAWIETDGSVLVIADADGKVIRRFPKQKNIPAYDWSPDGRWMVVAMEDAYANADIWILPIDDTEAKPYNISRTFDWDGCPVWSPDGKLVSWIGRRPGSDVQLCYLWLDRKAEASQKAHKYRKAVEAMGLRLTDRKVTARVLGVDDDELSEEKKDVKKGTDTPRVAIDFNGLHERVRRLNVPGVSAPIFAPDSRRILFPATINGQAGTYEIKLPDQLSPRKLSSRWGTYLGWFGDKQDRLLMQTRGRKIATLGEEFNFGVYQNLNIADYYELAFLSGWQRIRDAFYDGNFHGADWEAVKNKYWAMARFAPTYSVHNRIMQSMLGELNASHLGYYGSDHSRREWKENDPGRHAWHPVTSHLGITFDPAYEGKDGWRVLSVLPEGPADSVDVGLRCGDLVVAVDGRPVMNGEDPTLLLNGPKIGKFVLTVRSADGNERDVYIEAITYARARDLATKEMYAKRRAYVHTRSEGKLGYINIARMNDDEYNRFKREIFAEGFDKDGMVIDVRDNVGGFTADRVLDILGVQRHSWSVPRHASPAYLAGYWGRPVFDRPIVVLCNQNTVSNGEIFSHAIKQLKRGKLVGVQTNGGVIATQDLPLLDLGTFRKAHYGWYTLDGTDMELHGAIPDIVVELTPGDNVAGRDPQLDAAIDALLKDAEDFKKNNKPFVPNVFTHEHKL